VSARPTRCCRPRSERWPWAPRSLLVLSATDAKGDRGAARRDAGTTDSSRIIGNKLEMDLDAIPYVASGLAVVDELAHTRMRLDRVIPKRYQDVLELLDTGIDVYDPEAFSTSLAAALRSGKSGVVSPSAETVQIPVAIWPIEMVLIDLTPEQR